MNPADYPRCRSALYVPAINTRAVEKSRAIETDIIIFDLEDSVVDESLVTARNNLIDAFNKGDFGNSTCVVRCNAIGSTAYLDDLQTFRDCSAPILLLPKVSSIDDLITFEQDAAVAGLSENTVCWYMIETVAGVAAIAEIVSFGVDSRWPLAGLVVGHNDLAKESGVSLDSNRRYLLPWLMQIVLQAKLHGIPVLDSVYNQFRDSAGFNEEARQGKQMGFDGKTLIHPSQVAPANSVFRPDDAEIAQAEAIVAAFALPENASKGVINLSGEMVERLHLQQAEVLLKRLD